MKTFYEVTNVINDMGEASIEITDVVEAGKKPVSFVKHERSKDVYVDYFDSKDEADRFVRDNQEA